MLQASTAHADLVHAHTVLSLSFGRDSAPGTAGPRRQRHEPSQKERTKPAAPPARTHATPAPPLHGGSAAAPPASAPRPAPPPDHPAPRRRSRQHRSPRSYRSPPARPAAPQTPQAPEPPPPAAAAH